MTWPHNGVKNFFCIFQLKSKKIEKKIEKFFFWKKSIFEKKSVLGPNFGPKMTSKSSGHFFRPWCQYKSCRYWSSRSKYGKWAKSLEPFLRKLAKSLILGHFGYKSPKIAKTHFFLEKSGSATFFQLLCPNLLNFFRKILGAVFHNFCPPNQPTNQLRYRAGTQLTLRTVTS